MLLQGDMGLSFNVSAQVPGREGVTDCWSHPTTHGRNHGVFMAYP